MADEQRLAFPVGQFGGMIRHDPPSSVRFSIRRGATVVSVEPDAGTAWLAAHGRPDEPAPAAAWAELIGLDLIAEVDPEAPEAVDFARAHRLVPRMHGLGNRSEKPSRFFAGYSPDGLATFTWYQWRLWRESHLEPSLWDGCERLVANERTAGRTVDARDLLTETLRGLHVMLGLQVAYLDVARPTEEPRDE